MKPRIFVGINEIGDMTLRLSQGFRELGFPVTNLVLDKPSPLKRRHDRHDGYIKKGNTPYQSVIHLVRAFLRNAFSHDIFIFNFSTSFFSLFLNPRHKWISPLAYFDLFILGMMHKKIVVLANGCDVRHYFMVEHDAREKGDNYHICFDCDFKQRCNLPLKISKVRKIEKYADYIFAHPLTGYLFTKECLMPRLPIKLSTVSYKLTSSANPLVVHAPSKRSKKGTRYLLGAVERLLNEGYQFKFMLCEKMNNEEVKKKLTESEIVVDQLLARAYGLFAVEAMASGNVVLGNAHAGRHGLPEDLPIVTTNPSNIYEHLKSVLESPQLRLEKARQGRVYVEKYHDHIKVAKELLKKIGELEDPQN